MVYRKGEKPVERSWQEWSDRHPVALMIASGDRWFQAWCFQSCMTIPVLARKSGVSIGRLNAIDQDTPIRRAELEAIAAVWNVAPDQLIASLPDPALLVDGEI